MLRTATLAADASMLFFFIFREQTQFFLNETGQHRVRKQSKTHMKHGEYGGRMRV